jgi:hypothetical protein
VVLEVVDVVEVELVVVDVMDVVDVVDVVGQAKCPCGLHTSGSAVDAPPPPIRNASTSAGAVTMATAGGTLNRIMPPQPRFWS